MTHLARIMKRKMSLLASDLMMRAWNDGKLFSRFTGFDTRVSDFEFVEDDAWFDMDWFEKVISTHWNDDPDVFTRFTHRGHEAGERLISACREIDPGSLDRPGLERSFWHTAKLLQDLMVFIPVTHPLSLLFERKVTAILRARGVPEGDLETRLVEVSAPVKRNGPEDERLELRRIRDLRGSPGFDLDAALTRHCSTWSYLGYRDAFSQGYSLDFFREGLDDPGLDSAGSSQPLPPDLQFDSGELETIGELKEFVWFRNYRTERLFEALFLLEPLWERLSVECGLEARDLFFYLLDEVSRLFTHAEKVPAADLDARRTGHALLLDGDRFQIETGELLRKKEESMASPLQETSGEIRGMVVCRGRARGRVAVIHDDSELDRVSEGDILVTGMTTPDYLPAMRKAAAFVTDEGGVTCHAAITAREIGKPCIVGTRCATRVFKDGDIVDVDADDGIVRIVPL
jgi:phosphohistidine swiveling domain-containing protein